MQEQETVLGEDIKFRGKLEFDHQLRVNGQFKGTIHSGGDLSIGSRARVEADIQTGVLVLEGELTGNVVASRKASLRRNCHLRGDLRAPDLEVESGSRFTGSCIMD
ncbi:MAG: polymer-forming cytoskeletal protein [Leptospiraceae bacterium]|nr:polymer-forming cytoskeletal protein [Leptospiraceae bacterium]MCB1304701.1 polymer-forming cytoskeletal protein [Leptospiraceae bacterium]